ncbi:MAG TPA: hypothetical protein DIS90_04760 [Cytophagales bacterium]|nr:hypothetical protein [Cytophagales bacterium]
MSNEEQSGYRVRPRFKIESEFSVETLKKKIEEGLGQEQAPCTGSVNPGYITLYIPQKDQHYWSPQLNLTFEETEKGSLIRGLYGPRPVVWTMFVFFYSIIGLAILFIGVLGLSYWMLGKSTSILWLEPILILIFLSLYLVAYSGQKLGEKQMIILHDFIVKCTNLVI